MSDVPSFPEGTYRALPDPDSVKMADADAATGEQITVSLRVVDDNFPNVNGKTIRWFGNFTNQQGMDITLDGLRLMGWDGVSPVGDGQYECAGLGANHVEIVVKHETYQGKTRAKVAYVNAIGGLDPFAKKKPLSDAGKASLNERIRRHMSAGAPRTEAPRQPPPVTRPTPGARAIAQGTAPTGGQRPTGGYQPTHHRVAPDPKAGPTEPIAPQGTRPPDSPADEDDIPF